MKRLFSMKKMLKDSCGDIFDGFYPAKETEKGECPHKDRIAVSGCRETESAETPD